ncbi:hypothetical protein A9Z42_0066780 [Trichoderma parareesei]|uniref:Uncharacterized protein n=1 Tax=Trichoderma parareesei TaxID=858221 RepID=A0A2H2ZVA8_TRIPA|nr:hypothetical protein A9Z42_0066780 [Trichoderma parareesei]
MSTSTAGHAVAATSCSLSSRPAANEELEDGLELKKFPVFCESTLRRADVPGGTSVCPCNSLRVHEAMARPVQPEGARARAS